MFLSHKTSSYRRGNGSKFLMAKKKRKMVTLATLDSSNLDKATNIQHQKLVQFLLLMSVHRTVNLNFHTSYENMKYDIIYHVSVDLKQSAYSSKVW